MEWPTHKTLGTLFGVALIAALLIFDTGVLVSLWTRALDFVVFLGVLAVLLSLPVIGLIAYWLVGLRRSGYAMDRNQLTIYWGPIRHVVPMRAISKVVTGDQVSPRVRFRGARWPGLWAGSGDVPDIGFTLFNATTSLARQVLVLTDAAAYGISPADREGFLAAFAARKELGPTQDVAQESIRPRFFEWPLWRDRTARGLVAGGLVLCVALFGFLILRYPNLPARIPLHFDPLGRPDRFGGPPEAFILPVIGLLALVVNAGLGVPVYLRQRIPAYLLWSGAVLVQVLVWIAAVTLL